MSIKNKKTTIITTIGLTLSAGFIIGIGGFFGDSTSITDTMTRGLVGYWSMDESFGDTAYDASNYQNHGTWSGTGSHWATGKVGTAGQFNGSNDYVDCGNDASLNITDAITIEVWTKRGPGSENDVKIVGNFHPDTAGYIMQSYSGNLSFAFHDGTSYISKSFGGDYRDGQWHHFVITKDTAYIRAYIDGEAQTPIAENRQIIPSDYGLGIGVGSNVWKQFYFNGLIDEVRIYNRALSPAEILALFEQGREIR